MAIDKFILTHRGALHRKYGAVGVARIEAAVLALIKADARRGVASRLVCLDSVDDMAPWGGNAPAKATTRDIKGAVDRICAAETPHYLLLIGGPDILPMVPLKNPVYSADGDTDRVVPSDLPYACDAPYSTDAGRFVGPTRVVGRLPDALGTGNPALLTQLVRAAARAKRLQRADYAGGFALSAQVWRQSTELSAANTFGPATPVHAVPPGGHKWSKGQLAARMHFINCHGGDTSPDYFGQPLGVEEYPVALHAPWLGGKITAGTVVAAECCYGAQLWDPADAAGALPMPLAYLRDGASGFFGSTTIAYGPSEGNGAADLVCQYFLQLVLAGASLGRAVLEARQKFAGGKTHLDPFDLKTLAQFYLLGDPSAHPVAASSHALSKTAAFRKAFARTQDRTVRDLRRERLIRDGKHLSKTLPRLVAGTDLVPSLVADAMRAMARESGLRGPTAALSFDLQVGSAAGGRRLHVLKGRKRDADAGDAGATCRGPGGDRRRRTIAACAPTPLPLTVPAEYS